MTRNWVALARPRQWVKNLLLYAAFLFTAGDAWQLDDAASWAPLFILATAGCVVFCVLSSGAYFINDANDAESDRVHPRKQARPIAAGSISAYRARRMGIVLMSAGLAVSPMLGWWFALASLGYVALSALYSIALRRVPLVDAIAVGALFAIRAVAGAAAIEVRPSAWLILCTFFAAVFVIFVKRHQELQILQGMRSTDTGRGTLGLRPLLLRQLVAAAGVVTAGLYLGYAATASNLPDNRLMLLTVPLVGYGLYRYYVVSRESPERDAEELVLRDPALVTTVIMFLLVALAVLLGG